MRNLISLFFFLLFSFNSCRNDNIKLEKFVWIQHNQNWIHNPKDLEARIYLDYLDSCRRINMALIKIHRIRSEYFTKNAPDSLKSIIFKNLYLKQFPPCFEDRDSIPHIYDGDLYCIIYKFSNDVEHIINYKPFTIPDSLREFTNYLEKLAEMKNYEKRDSFDRSSLIEKYRDLIIPCGPLAPPPAPNNAQVKYVAPVIVDSIPK